MKKILSRYKKYVYLNLSQSLESDERDLRYWQGRLFSSFLVYCLPVSLIALIPGVWMSIKDGVPLIAVVDLSCFGLIALATFSQHLNLRYRKIMVISVFYSLAIFLIEQLGYVGPGVFYLFFITVLIALVFPIRYAYRSIGINTVILGSFAFVIGFKLFGSPLIAEYNVGKWGAFSVNLIFASLVIVLLVDKIFEGLQRTIHHKTEVQDRYRLIFDKSPLPMWLFDTDTYRFLNVNDAVVRHYGYTKSDFLSMTIMDIRYKEHIPETAELVRANKLSGEFYGGNSQHIKKNGEMIYVKIESNLISLDGRPARLVQATDITAEVQHQLEVFRFNARIKESEANLRALFDNTPDGFVLLDADQCIKLFNPKALEAMQLNRDQASFEVGRPIFDYVETFRLPFFSEIISRVYAGETMDYDRMYRTKGAIHWIRYTLTPVREEEQIVGACITGRDITARKLYLRSIEEQNRVFREISWMQSHLVRAPLARIMGLLPILRNERDEDKLRELLDYLDTSAGELDEVIKNITRKSTHIIDKYPQLSEKE